jgi:hypothetical protein
MRPLGFTDDRALIVGLQATIIQEINPDVWQKGMAESRRANGIR